MKMALAVPLQVALYALAAERSKGTIFSIVLFQKAAKDCGWRVSIPWFSITIFLP